MKKIFLISIILCFIISCQKDITIIPSAYNQKLSIQCLISPNLLPEAYIYLSVPYFDAKITASSLFVRNATLRLQCTNQEIDFTIDSLFNVRNCEYILFWKGNKAVLPNQDYTLTIYHLSDTLKAYTKTTKAKVNMDSIGYLTSFSDVYGAHEGVVLNFRDPKNVENYYRYEMLLAIYDTIINQEGSISPCSIGKLNLVKEIGRTIYTDENTDGLNMKIIFEPTYKHKKGLEGKIVLLSMDKNTYLFYDNLDKNKVGQYNPFVEPTFLYPGQFGNKAIGVFGAFAVSDTIKFIYPE